MSRWSGEEDTLIEGGIMYRLVQDTSNHIYVIANGDTTLLSDNDAIVPQLVEKVDLNRDGYDDVIVNLFSNTPGDEMLFLFDTTAHSFVPLKNSSYYMNTEPLRGTPCCWTYNRAGCADYNWESWLFAITNDSAYSLGHMEARICPADPGPRVLVYRSIGNEDVERVDSIPADTSIEYFRGKWEMMEAYWTKHYKLFLRGR